METPTQLAVSAKVIRWRGMFSSSVHQQSITVTCPAADWVVRSAPWWLDVRRDGNELRMRPRNCGFYSGTVKIQHGRSIVSIEVSASILPTFWGVLRGLGAGSAASVVPLIGAGAILGCSLLLGLLVLFSLGPYGINPLAMFVPMAAVGLLMVGPIPLLMGISWGIFLRSWRAWFHSVLGLVLGAILALVSFGFIHEWFPSSPPGNAELFLEISLLAWVWVGTVAACAAGWRMGLLSVPVVLLATALMLTFAAEPAREAFTDLEKPARKVVARNHSSANKESPAEFLRFFEPSGGGMLKSFRWGVYASLYVQLTFVMSLPLLMISLVPILKPSAARVRQRRAERMDWRRSRQLTPAAWGKVRL